MNPETGEFKGKKVEIQLDSKLAERLFLKLEEYSARLKKYHPKFDGTAMPHDFHYMAPEVRARRADYHTYLKWALLKELVDHGELVYHPPNSSNSLEHELYDDAFKVIELYAENRADEVAGGTGLPKIESEDYE